MRMRVRRGSLVYAQCTIVMTINVPTTLPTCSQTYRDFEKVVLRALETFNALGIQFVSLAEQVDTSTPTGKMIFTVLGAVSELERNLTVERVHSGLRHARAKGKRLGRPRKTVDAVRIAALRKNGNSWRTIAREMKLSVGTVFGANQDLPEPGLYEPHISYT